MVKPAELIEVQGASSLSLSDRRLFNILLRNAFGPDLASEAKEFQIPLSDLRGTHDNNDRLIGSIEALMKTVVYIRKPDGSTDRAQLLGDNNLTDPNRPRGVLTYTFPARLAAALADSTVYARLELEILHAFTSKYALALYEAVARRVRLSHMTMEVFELDAFRELLGVEEGKLGVFGNLNRKAIAPALVEVNALAPFGVVAQPRRTGRRVTHVCISWWDKDVNARKEAYQELKRPKVGRRARLNGTAEDVAPSADLFEH
ncbi:replication initiation protein [uncultured Ruegeria sp.]|nr:replication initiation protein [uncultured Ruegeria sp.]